jgi:hypothetical protein
MREKAKTFRDLIVWKKVQWNRIQNTEAGIQEVNEKCEKERKLLET